MVIWYIQRGIRMPSDDRRLTDIREHMRWARTYALYWLVMCLVLFGGAYAIAEFTELAVELRVPLLLMVGTIIVVNAVWQAAGLTIIRLEQIVLPRAVERFGNRRS